MSSPFSSKKWFSDGWSLFKKKPLTWVIMLLVFNILLIVVGNIPSGRYIVALIFPVLTGGIYLAAHKSSQGEVVSIENLFSMFKNREKLQQLLIIGGISMIMVAVSSLLGVFVVLPWLCALLFAVPLVAIKNEQAFPALKSSLMASFFNFLPIVVFFLLSLVLIVLAIIPVGLGLFVLVPVLFGASYSAFRMVYLEETEAGADTEAGQSFGERLMGNINYSMVGETESNGDVVLPKGFEINYYDEYMHIFRRWHGLGAYLLIIAALAAIGYLIANDAWAFLMSDQEILPRLFMWGVAVIGVTTTPYFILASWLNKTHIYVSKHAIEIKHEPIPWMGNKRVETKNIKQFFVEQSCRNENKRSTYSVIGLTFDGEPFSLIRGLRESSHAFYIEQRIEKYLGIKDIANPDEFGYGFVEKEG